MSNSAPLGYLPESASPEPARTEAQERNGGTSVEKAMQLLSSFHGSTAPAGVSELARRAGMAKSTAFRLLAALEEGDFIDRVGKDYQLSWRVFELGSQVRSSRHGRLHATALPYLCELFAETRQVVRLSVLDGDDVICLERIHGARTMHDAIRVGSRLPFNCTAAGKVLMSLSEPDDIRRALAGELRQCTPRSIIHPGVLFDQLRRARVEGVAFDREESQAGFSTLAAPVLLAGQAVAAISVAAPAKVFNTAFARDAVVRAAKRIAADPALLAV